MLEWNFSICGWFFWKVPSFCEGSLDKSEGSFPEKKSAGNPGRFATKHVKETLLGSELPIKLIIEYMSSWAHHNTLCYTYCCYLKGCRDFRVWEGDYSKKRTCQAWSLQSGASVAIQDNLIRPPSKRWSSGIISKIYLLFGGTTGKLPSCRPANLFRDAKREHVSWIPSCLQSCHEGTIHHSELMIETGCFMACCKAHNVGSTPQTKTWDATLFSVSGPQAAIVPSNPKPTCLRPKPRKYLGASGSSASWIWKTYFVKVGPQS